MKAELGDRTAVSSTVITLAVNQGRFLELLDRHDGIVAKVAHTYCWQAQDREELEQEIVTQLWRSFSRYDEAQPFSTWMYRVALNVAISWVRRHSLQDRRTTTLGDDVDRLVDASDGGAEDERITFLRDFIADLDPLNRALMLLYLDAYAYREISSILGISETNVATKISRLKHRVRQQHSQTLEEDSPHGTR